MVETQAGTRTATVASTSRRGRRGSWGLYAITIFTVVLSFFPTVWLFLTSVKPRGEIYAWPITFLPKHFTFENYVHIVTQNAELLRYILNSLIVATATTFLILAIGGLAAYSLSRLSYRGRGAILVGILAVSMFPPLALLPSLFNMFLQVHMLSTYPALILAHTGLYLPMAIWILASFYRTIPYEIEDSARIDGASSLRVFWSVILPLSTPGLIATGLIAFIMSWNEFPLALVLMPQNSMRTAPVGLSLFPGQYAFPWETISAATILAIVPVLLITGVFQERLIGGLTAGASK